MAARRRRQPDKAYPDGTWTDAQCQVHDLLSACGHRQSAFHVHAGLPSHLIRRCTLKQEFRQQQIENRLIE